MILDDLFAQAVKDSKFGSTVQAVVTHNQTGGFNSQNTNKASAAAPLTLTYSPQKVVIVHHIEGFVPAKFFGGNPLLTISAPTPLHGQYGVETLGTVFVPAVDAATNIVYGAAGSVFVTISLCGYVPNTG